jgi:hypothetical protein
MNKEDKYINESKYKIQVKDIRNKWIDDTPKASYSKDDAELIVKSYIKRGRKRDSVKIVKEESEKIDILDKLEIETLIRETEEFLDDDELSEKAIEAAGWGKSSVEKFGKTIGKSPSEHGFFDACTARMSPKKGWGKEKAEGFCARLIDTAKGTTKWRGKKD